VPPRVEIGELVDAVQQVGHQLLEEQPRRHADLAAQLARHRPRQRVDAGVVRELADAGAVRGVGGVHVADLLAHLDQALVGEGGQAHLHRPQVVEARLRLEVHVQALRQRLQPLDPLRPLEERGRPGHQQVQPGEPAGIDLIDELAQGLEPASGCDRAAISFAT
jgi:hypothetical protein